MSWKVTGRSMESCSCNAWCSCWLGPEEPADQGWCRGILAYDIETGNSDGIDLAGCKVVVMAHWPGNFFEGNGNARLFIGDNASADQQRELEAIYSGNKGGLLEGLFGAVMSTWQSAQAKNINIAWGDNPTVSVEGIGQVSATPFADEAGNQVTVTGAAAQGAFQIKSMVLANGRESNWSDPDLGDWQGNSCTLHTFDWAA
jgi:hypothetical protein